MSSNIKYSSIRPKLDKHIILRYAEPDPPLIYNRKTNELIKAKSYRVLDILKLCDGNNSIEYISLETHVDMEKIYYLLLKIEKLGWLHFEK